MDHEFYEDSGGPAKRPWWIINYDADRALRNHDFISRCCGRRAGIHVSRDCGAIVVSSLPLAEIKEPHVMAWRDSFYEIDRETLALMAGRAAA